MTGLERKIEAEYADLQKTIARLREILGDIRLVYEIIKEELLAIKEEFADERRTIIGRSGEIRPRRLDSRRGYCRNCHP